MTVRVARTCFRGFACGTAQTFPAGSVSHYRHERNARLARFCCKRVYAVGRSALSEARRGIGNGSTSPRRRLAESSSVSGCSAPAIRHRRLRLRAKHSSVHRPGRIGAPREYKNPVTGEAVLPSSGAWEHLFPRAIDSASPCGSDTSATTMFEKSVDRTLPGSAGRYEDRSNCGRICWSDLRVILGRKMRPGVTTVQITS